MWHTVGLSTGCPSHGCVADSVVPHGCCPAAPMSMVLHITGREDIQVQNTFFINLLSWELSVLKQ